MQVWNGGGLLSQGGGNGNGEVKRNWEVELIGLSHRLDVRERKITGAIQMSGIGALLDGDYDVIAESEGPVGQAVATSVKGLDM